MRSLAKIDQSQGEAMRSKTAPKHIAVYLHTLYNGGVERVMFNLIQAFLDRGISVDLVLDFLVFSPYEKLLPKGAQLVNLGVMKSRQRVTKLFRYVRDGKPEAILSATHFANEVACIAVKLSGIKTRLLLSEHTNLSSDIRDSRGIARRALLPLTTRYLYPMADEVIAVSNGVADDMCRVSGLARNRVKTVYNPVDFKTLAALAMEPLNEPWFAKGQPPVILAIGRLEAQKNFPNLLRALIEVRRSHEAKVIILGEGSQRSRLISLVAEMGLNADVSMPGFVPNPAAYMARAALFALPSSWEGMPMALIEALTLGIPVVSTDCPSGPCEILDGGKYGALVPMDDSVAFAKAVIRVLEGEKRPNATAWLRQFDSDLIAERYLELMSG
jgi:glycosyltransferase involved in cell wall biosynthesis